LRAVRPKLPGWLLEVTGNGDPRGMIATTALVTDSGTEPGLWASSTFFTLNYT